MMNLEEKQLRFQDCISQVLCGQSDGGIGTYSEKLTHRVIKNYISNNPLTHEVRVGGFIADVKLGDTIYEIQSKDFYRMESKLASLLRYNKVQLIYPVVTSKRIAWIDPVTNQITDYSKSTKKMSKCSILAEMYGIRQLLLHNNLVFRLICLEELEYKYLDGHGKNGRNGATKINRIPTTLVDDVILEDTTQIIDIISNIRGETFTAEQFKKSNRLREPYKALGTLMELGLVTKVGKENRKVIYKLL